MESNEQRDARVAALYRVARPAYLATLANAGILLVLLWGPLPATVLLSWFGLLLAATAARVALHWQYHRRTPGTARAKAWEERFALGALAAGATWAYAAAVFFPAGDPLLQMAVVFVIGGSIIGAAGVYAPSPLAFYAFSVLPYAAVAWQLFAQPGFTYQLLALMVLVFGAAMVRVYRDIHGGIVETLATKLRNEELLAQVGAVEARLRDAIESFPEAIAVWDAERRLVAGNAAYARLYGADRGAAPAPAAGDVVRGERWFREKTTPTLGGGQVSSATDITDLKQAQEAYLRVLAEEDLVFDMLPVGVAFVQERVIVRCNRRLEQMLGYAPGELRGQSARIFFQSDDEWTEAARIYDRLGDGKVREGDAALTRKDGLRLWCRVQSRALNPSRPRESAIFTFVDVEERRAIESALKGSEALYRGLVETSNDLIWSIDRERRWSFLNGAALRRIYGHEPRALYGSPLGDLSAPEVRERDAAVFGRVLAGEPVFDYETRHLRRDGTRVDLSFNAVPLRDANDEIVGAAGTARDVSEQKRAAAALHESVEKLRLAVDAADLVHWEWDAASDQLLWGRDPRLLFGEAGERVRRWADQPEFVLAEDRERFLAAGQATLERGEPYAVEYRVAGPAGRVAWIAARGIASLDADGRVARLVGVSQDITERKRREEEVRFLAYHDSLTGLPNRRLLDDRLQQAMFLAQRRGSRMAVMLVDLDDFKRVNDSLGHRAGDAVLREAAQRLAGCIRKADTLARHGGDEFAIVIPDLQQESDCQVVSEKILRALEAEFLLDGRAFRLGASIGISLYPADAGDGDALLRNADVAMYRAKQLGKNNYRFYGR